VVQREQAFNDEQVEQVMGNLLRCGVLTAAAVVAAGGAVYLARHGSEPVNYHTFHGEPSYFERPWEIVAHALAGSGRGIIQLGLLLLIATPVARVIFSVFAFARQRDYTYVILTLIVLAVLLYSLFVGQP
jgi:uncharacterized membrane protein